jgi:anaerobic selenocysteine-containing dehydrogenase
MARALSSLDFLVNVDLFLTDTSRYADIVLPACSSVERSEFRCYPQGWALLSQPAIEPLYESRSDAHIIFDLARRLGLDDPLFEAGYDASLDWILEPSGMTVEQLKAHPFGMAVPDRRPPAERSCLTAGFPTPSGRMEFASSPLAEYAESHGYEALPIYRPPRYSPEAAPELAAEYPFILNTGSRLPMFVHSRTFRVPWNRMLRPRAAADLHPADAARLGVSQGDRIRISTPSGSIEVDANLTGSGLPGVVHMYHGYREADVNTLFEPDYQDPISGFPGYKSLLCQVQRMGAASAGSTAPDGGTGR